MGRGERRRYHRAVIEAAHPFRLRRFAASLAWLGLMLSLVVHVASFLGVSLMQRFVFLHLGIFALGVPVVLSSRNLSLLKKAAAARWRAVLDGAPAWAQRAVQLAFLYFALNLIALLLLGERGSPEIRGGRFVLVEGRRIIRELTESEYRWKLAHVARMFSAGWGVAYLFFAAIWYRAPATGPAPLGRSDHPG